METGKIELYVSGGQYDCGTTDVTRTFHLGEPTEYQKMCFSRVLQVASLYSSLNERPKGSHNPTQLPWVL